MRSGRRGGVRSWATVAACLAAVVLAHSPVLASDQWSRPGRGLRLLHRHARHLDHTPLDLFAVFVDLCDPAVQVRATAPDEAGQTASSWAHSVHAAVAINGDYFEGSPPRPLGPARGRGVWWPDGPREHRDALLLANASGQVSVLDAPDGTEPALWTDAVTRVGSEWTEVVGVRERVLVHGEVHLSARIRHDDDRRHPRTGVGLSQDGHTLLLLVVNGRSETSSGATATELAGLLRELGAWEGMKLDGGGSSTLFVAGHGVLNRPSDGQERHTANQLGICLQNDALPGPRAACMAPASHRSPPPQSPAAQASVTSRAAHMFWSAALRPGARAPSGSRRSGSSWNLLALACAALLAPRSVRVARHRPSP